MYLCFILFSNMKNYRCKKIWQQKDSLQSLHSQNGPAHLLPGNKHDDGRRKNWPSPPVIIFFPISEFPYILIRFLLHSSLVKSDNEIGKFSY